MFEGGEGDKCHVVRVPRKGMDLLSTIPIHYKRVAAR